MTDAQGNLGVQGRVEGRPDNAQDQGGTQGLNRPQTNPAKPAPADDTPSGVQVEGPPDAKTPRTNDPHSVTRETPMEYRDQTLPPQNYEPGPDVRLTDMETTRRHDRAREHQDNERDRIAARSRQNLPKVKDSVRFTLPQTNFHPITGQPVGEPVVLDGFVNRVHSDKVIDVTVLHDNGSSQTFTSVRRGKNPGEWYPSSEDSPPPSGSQAEPSSPDKG